MLTLLVFSELGEQLDGIMFMSMFIDSLYFIPEQQVGQPTLGGTRTYIRSKRLCGKPAFLFQSA